MRRQSKIDVHYHLVWATKHRQGWLDGPCERLAYSVIRREAEEVGCVVLALNGMPDHVHLVVRTRSCVSPATLAKQVKGVSSTCINDAQILGDTLFRWQDGYACFSLSRSHVARVIGYVERQKEHHSDQTIWAEWEETDVEVGH
jgi:putative transposase